MNLLDISADVIFETSQLNIVEIQFNVDGTVGSLPKLYFIDEQWINCCQTDSRKTCNRLTQNEMKDIMFYVDTKHRAVCDNTLPL